MHTIRILGLRWKIGINKRMDLSKTPVLQRQHNIDAQGRRKPPCITTMGMEDKREAISMMKKDRVQGQDQKLFSRIECQDMTLPFQCVPRYLTYYLSRKQHL